MPAALQSKMLDASPSAAPAPDTSVLTTTVPQSAEKLAIDSSVATTPVSGSRTVPLEVIPPKDDTQLATASVTPARRRSKS